MPKFIIGFSIFLLFYSVYFDLKVGTLPTSGDTIDSADNRDSEQGSTKPYQEIRIQPGETVLTILERLHNGSLPVAIELAVADFEKLNPKTSAQSIRSDKTYRFPLYR